MDLHIIYTRSAMLLSRTHYASWRDIQDQYPDYQTSLGPWSADDVIAYLEEEYSGLEPSAAQQVAALAAAREPVWVVHFSGRGPAGQHSG